MLCLRQPFLPCLFGDNLLSPFPFPNSRCHFFIAIYSFIFPLLFLSPFLVATSHCHVHPSSLVPIFCYCFLVGIWPYPLVIYRNQFQSPFIIPISSLHRFVVDSLSHCLYRGFFVAVSVFWVITIFALLCLFVTVSSCAVSLKPSKPPISFVSSTYGSQFNMVYVFPGVCYCLFFAVYALPLSCILYY